ncbi:MAG: hypothetical protein ACFFD2_00570, partial [Promethearchaeota archaeon]
SPISGEVTEKSKSEDTIYQIQFKLTKHQQEELEQKFQTIIIKEKGKFPLSEANPEKEEGKGTSV